MAFGLEAARPTLIRAMNEQLILDFVRRGGEVSRAELAKLTGLSKPTVAVSLSNLEGSGLIRRSGVRTGVPGPATSLYEVNAEAGYVLGLDVGQRFIRGAVSDLAGRVRIRRSEPSAAESGSDLVAAVIKLSEELVANLQIDMDSVLQVVLGAPGVHDLSDNSIKLAGALHGWDDPGVLSGLRAYFGEDLLIENDVNAAALAEYQLVQHNTSDGFIFLSVGTGIGMGVIINGQLHRGAHGAAGEIGFLPVSDEMGIDESDVLRRGRFDSAASAAGVVRAAKHAGMRGSLTAKTVFGAAKSGDALGIEVVRREARLVAQAVCSVIAIVDPQFVVLGGGIGRASGFVEAVIDHVVQLSPTVPEIRVSAEGDDAVVDGCIVLGIELGWKSMIAKKHS